MSRFMSYFKDCGWEYVDGRNFVHVFRAPENSEAPEFYMEPAQQAETLKGLKRHYMTSVLNTPMYLTTILLMGFLVDGFANGKWHINSAIRKWWIPLWMH